MPLSEEEQRILQEIERSFYENDPDFAGKVGAVKLERHPGRNARWAALGFVVGMVMLIAFLSNTVLAFVGFLVMLGSAFLFQRDLRRMDSGGFQQWAKSVKSGGMATRLGRLGGTRQRLREKFKRED